MRKNRIAIAVTAGALLGFTGMSGVADAARCGGQPDGIVDPSGPGTGTWDSPGEVISYFNTVVGVHSNVFAPPGAEVKALCAGAPAP